MTGNLSRTTQFLHIFQQVTGLISTVLDHQTVMDTMVRRLPDLFGVDACTIRLLESSTRTFVLGAAHGVSLEYLSREVVDTEATMTMVQSGHPVHSTHVDEDPFIPFRAAASKEGIKDVLTLPILYQGDLIGMMRLLTKAACHYQADEIACAMALAEQVGIAIAHGRLFKKTESQLVFLREIQELSRVVNSTLDLNHVLTMLAERVTVAMAVKGCTLRLLKPETNRLELAASHGLSADYLERGGIESERNIRLVLAGDPVAIYDVSADQRVDYHQQMRDEGIVSLLAVPLKVDGEVIGVMRVLSDTPRVFTDTEVRFAVTLAEVGGAAIRNARNYQQIHLLLERIEGHEQFLSNIINNLEHQLLVFDRQRQVVLANRAFLQKTGLEEKDVLGADYSVFCRSTAGGEACPVDQLLQGDAVQPVVQEVLLDGQSRWVERTASPITDGRGTIEYVIEIIRDITTERMLAREREQSSTLQRLVELAGTVAHEINSPLFAALGTAELLMEECKSDAMAEELSIILRNLKQIGELTATMTSMTGFTGKEYVGDSRILTLAAENTKKEAEGS